MQVHTPHPLLLLLVCGVHVHALETHTHTHLKHNLRIYPEAQELPAQMDFGMRTYVVGTQELLLIHTHE